jgi:CRISPR-associated protein Csy3
MAKTSLKTASVLAFERKLDPSDALFYAGQWEDKDSQKAWPSVTVHEKSIRGTISNRLNAKEQDPAKLDASIQNPNLQRVDVATLAPDADTLRVCFTLRVLGGTGSPSACNNAEYREKLINTVASYVEEHGFMTLARRYALNLANGRFLWRNRISSEKVDVRVRHLKNGELKGEWLFDSLNYSLRDFIVPEGDFDKVEELAQVIEKGLSGREYALLEVTAHARMGAGQEVFPSQELILDKGSAKGQKSKTLYSVDNTAALHSQKVGNALRTIDTWYEDEEGLGPIAVEPYGSVTSQGKAYRQPKKKMDFYSLLDNWVLRDQPPSDQQKHFVMAILIRGGVFGEKD